MSPRKTFTSPATDEHWMKFALEEADAAVATGDVPIGCVIVGPDGLLVGRGHNRREADFDPTAHAEVLALRAAAVTRRQWRLDDCTLYVTLEPCVMCAGAMVNARVARVVFGALDPKAGAMASLYSIGSDQKLNHEIEIEGGLFAAESVEQLKRFFGGLRAQGQK